MIKRSQALDHVKTALSRSRVVALIGPRQCGKTTLARQLVAPDSLNYFDLEDPASLARIEQPMTALRDLKGLVVIDEVQLLPAIFPVLRVLTDRVPLPAKFLVLVSASPQLVERSSESLAGRIETVALSGFCLSELGGESMRRHWLRGGFPLSYLARSEADSAAWRKSFIRTFIERDLQGRVGPGLPPQALLRFWTMLAHYHGQTWNAAGPARSLGVSQHTARRYLDLLTGLFLVNQLQPWHENLKKRQVKAPKIYLRDSGLLHQLVGIGAERDLMSHPKCGASWEGYAIEETLKAVRPDEAYFWATHNGAELDLLLIKDGRRLGVECKRMDAPRMTPSMKIALEDLRLERLAVLYPGEKRYSLGDRVEAVPLDVLADPGATIF